MKNQRKSASAKPVVGQLFKHTGTGSPVVFLGEVSYPGYMVYDKKSCTIAVVSPVSLKSATKAEKRAHLLGGCEHIRPCAVCQQGTVTHLVINIPVCPHCFIDAKK